MQTVVYGTAPNSSNSLPEGANIESISIKLSQELAKEADLNSERGNHAALISKNLSRVYSSRRISENAFPQQTFRRS
jgi:hypothetical protein